MRSLKTSEVAEILKISVDAARMLGDTGVIKSYRTEGNHRRYDSYSVYTYRDSILGSKDKKTIIYVTSKLDNKESLKGIREFCEKQGWDYSLMRDNSAARFEESAIKELIGMIEKDEVSRIFFDSIEEIDEKHFNCIKEICGYHNVQVIVYISEEKRELGMECLMNL